MTKEKINFPQFFKVGILVFVLAVSLSACGNKIENVNQPLLDSGTDDYVVSENDFVDGSSLLMELPQGPLSQTEIDGLLLMREEEKLARDVYKTLASTWNLNIFSNIAESEQTHTDAVKVLLDRYKIVDPVSNDMVGVFKSSLLADLYENLITQGSKSLLDALIVGATVEDLDINDLNKLLAETDNADIIPVYENLNRGSRNHLRAFVKQIVNNGGQYVPQYISQTEFDQIVSGSQETGAGRGR